MPEPGSCCTVAEAATEWYLFHMRARDGGEWDGAGLFEVTTRLESAVQAHLKAKRDPTQPCPCDSQPEPTDPGSDT